MYKKQMLFQRIICYLVLIGSAVVFFYSLGMMTDLYDGLRQTIPEPTILDMNDESGMGPKVEGARILYDMQDFNRFLTKGALILVLLSVFLLITSTHIRRRYYISNYIATGLSAVAGIAYSVYTISELFSWKLTYQLYVDFEKLEKLAKILKFQYYGPDHTFWFDAGVVVMIVYIVLLALLVLNMIWKIIMMNAEKKLLEAGKEAKANG